MRIPPFMNVTPFWDCINETTLKHRNADYNITFYILYYIYSN